MLGNSNEIIANTQQLREEDLDNKEKEALETILDIMWSAAFNNMKDDQIPKAFSKVDKLLKAHPKLINVGFKSFYAGFDLENSTLLFHAIRLACINNMQPLTEFIKMLILNGANVNATSAIDSKYLTNICANETIVTPLDALMNFKASRAFDQDAISLSIFQLLIENGAKPSVSFMARVFKYLTHSSYMNPLLETFFLMLNNPVGRMITFHKNANDQDSTKEYIDAHFKFCFGDIFNTILEKQIINYIEIIQYFSKYFSKILPGKTLPGEIIIKILEFADVDEKVLQQLPDRLSALNKALPSVVNNSSISATGKLAYVLSAIVPVCLLTGVGCLLPDVTSSVAFFTSTAIFGAVVYMNPDIVEKTAKTAQSFIDLVAERAEHNIGAVRQLISF